MWLQFLYEIFILSDNVNKQWITKLSEARRDVLGLYCFSREIVWSYIVLQKQSLFQAAQLVKAAWVTRNPQGPQHDKFFGNWGIEWSHSI